MTVPQVGEVRDGAFFSAVGGREPLVLKPTPAGVGMQIVLHLSEQDAVRGKTTISRTVAVPDAPEVAWSELLDVAPVESGPVYAAPQWAQDALTAAIAAEDALADSITARTGAQLFRDQAREARDAALAVGATSDAQQAANLGNPASASAAAVAGILEPQLSRERRAALADRIAEWLTTFSRSDRGDLIMQGTVRRGTIRKASSTSPYLTEFSLRDEEPQTTAAGQTLQYLALYAKTYPEKSAQVRPAIDHLVAYISSMQCLDERVPQYGGIASAAGSMVYGGFGTAQCVRGIVAAYEVFGIGQWLDVAIKAGTFLTTLSNPNPVYQRIYGIDVIDPPAGSPRFVCERITNGGVLWATANLWNLVAAQAFRALFSVTGNAVYNTLSGQIRDAMAYGFLNYYDYFGMKVTTAGTSAGLVDPRPPTQQTAPNNDNLWHRDGDVVGRGTIGSDSMEYALTALWETGYNLAQLKAAYEHLDSLLMEVIPSTATTAFKAAYNAVNRHICWPGYFRINDAEYGGASEAWGGYLDLQGAGENLAWKKAHYPAHYALTLPIISAAADPDSTALMDENFDPYWSTDARGLYAVKGTIPIAVSGIGLLSTNPPYDLEVTT